MPVFTPTNFKEISTSLEIFPKDDYEMQIGEPKTFNRTNRAGNPSFGVRIPLTHTSGQYQNKKAFLSLYYQSQGAEMMAKQFLIAALGYGRGTAEEARFNNDWGNKDWSFDLESGGVGDAWRELVGGRVVVSFDQDINSETGDAQQVWKGYRPIQK